MICCENIVNITLLLDLSRYNGKIKKSLMLITIAFILITISFIIPYLFINFHTYLFSPKTFSTLSIYPPSFVLSSYILYIIYLPSLICSFLLFNSLPIELELVAQLVPQLAHMVSCVWWRGDGKSM